MSSDVLGAYIAHRDAATAIEDVRERMASSASTGYPLSDVLLATADYNAAVESAPENVPWAYWYMEKDLNDRWAEYQLNRNAARINSSSPMD